MPGQYYVFDSSTKPFPAGRYSLRKVFRAISSDKAGSGGVDGVQIPTQLANSGVVSPPTGSLNLVFVATHEVAGCSRKMGILLLGAPGPGPCLAHRY